MRAANTLRGQLGSMRFQRMQNKHSEFDIKRKYIIRWTTIPSTPPFDSYARNATRKYSIDYDFTDMHASLFRNKARKIEIA